MREHDSSKKHGKGGTILDEVNIQKCHEREDLKAQRIGHANMNILPKAENLSESYIL